MLFSASKLLFDYLLLFFAYVLYDYSGVFLRNITIKFCVRALSVLQFTSLVPSYLYLPTYILYIHYISTYLASEPNIVFRVNRASVKLKSFLCIVWLRYCDRVLC